jgi:hypothetical protein
LATLGRFRRGAFGLDEGSAWYCQTNEAGYAGHVGPRAIPFNSFPDMLAFDLKREANEDGARLELFQPPCSDNTVHRQRAVAAPRRSWPRTAAGCGEFSPRFLGRRGRSRGGIAALHPDAGPSRSLLGYMKVDLRLGRRPRADLPFTSRLSLYRSATLVGRAFGVGFRRELPSDISRNGKCRLLPSYSPQSTDLVISLRN